MSKVIRLTENDIEKLVKKIINEDLPEREQERKDTNFRRMDFKPYKREKNIQKLFGRYAEDVPPQVIQYLRKIPATIIKRMVSIYGYDRIQGYLDKAVANQVQESYNFKDLVKESNQETDVTYFIIGDLDINDIIEVSAIERHNPSAVHELNHLLYNARNSKSNLYKVKTDYDLLEDYHMNGENFSREGLNMVRNNAKLIKSFTVVDDKLKSHEELHNKSFNRKLDI